MKSLHVFGVACVDLLAGLACFFVVQLSCNCFAFAILVMLSVLSQTFVHKRGGCQLICQLFQGRLGHGLRGS